MRTCEFIAVLIIGTGLLGGNVWSRPVDLSAPSGDVGAADLKGYLEIWREIEGAGINLGKGSYLPLRYKFSSEDNTGGILGPGFYIPMFEARNVLIREQMMRAFLPCGKGLYLRRDNLDPTKFQTVDQEWTGALSGDNGDNFTIWRDDGWKILYHQGRLTSITNDEHHLFTWNYDGNSHMATGISEDGKSLVTVEPNQQGLVDAIIFDGKRYELGYSERPLIEMVLGQPAVKQLAIALSSFKYPDGKTEAFQFTLTPERVPTVTFTDPDQKQTVYTWDAATDHIATEEGPKGDWTYKIGDIIADFGLPPISRTNSDGKTEGMAIDTKMGTYTSQAANGVTTITTVFESPGPLYNKVRSIEKVSNGKKTTVLKAFYSETGKLIRQLDARGFIISYQYDANGKRIGRSISLSQDPVFLASLAIQEKMLLEKLKGATTQQGRDAILNDLYIFYVGKSLDYNKAETLLNLMTNKDEIYNLKLCLATNPSYPAEKQNEMLAQLVQEFPDKKSYTELHMTKKETQ